MNRVHVQPRFFIAALVVAAGVSGCGSSISEPWVSGERLEDERTRTDAQQKQLRDRLIGYAEPYD